MQLTTVRLANRLKALSMTNHSSDEEDDSQRPVSRDGHKKKSNGAAFMEVVRATMNAKKEQEAASAVGKP